MHSSRLLVDYNCNYTTSVLLDLMNLLLFFSVNSYCFAYVQTMDISKMAPGDASFTAPFKLVAERDDYIHALVAYFDVSFTKCHKLTGFSTGSFPSTRTSFLSLISLL